MKTKYIKYIAMLALPALAFGESIAIDSTTSIVTDSSSDYYYGNYSNDTLVVDPSASMSLNFGSSTDTLPEYGLYLADDGDTASLTVNGLANKPVSINTYGYLYTEDVDLSVLYTLNVRAGSVMYVDGTFTSSNATHDTAININIEAGASLTVTESMTLDYSTTATINGTLTVSNGLYLEVSNQYKKSTYTFGADSKLDLTSSDAALNNVINIGLLDADGKIGTLNIVTLSDDVFSGITWAMDTALNQYNVYNVNFSFTDGTSTANGKVSLGSLSLQKYTNVSITLFDIDSDDVDGVSDSVVIEGITVSSGSSLLSLELIDYQNDLLQILGDNIEISEEDSTTLIVDGQSITITATTASGVIYTDGFYLTDDGFLNNYYCAVPEPSTYAMIFGGLALAFAFIRRRK